MEIPEGKPRKIAENRTLKAGSSPPEQRGFISKSLFFNNLRSKTFGKIQNRDPHRLMSRLNPRLLQATLFELGHTPIDAWIRWISIVMADDENSDFVANVAEQEVITHLEWKRWMDSAQIPHHDAELLRYLHLCRPLFSRRRLPRLKSVN
jgi:hypothetical protein